MKYKMLVLILLLTVMSWAQSATPSASSNPQQGTVPADQAKCACCDKMSARDTKAGATCCAHHNMEAKDGKQMASDEDAISCMKSSHDQARSSCCNDACSKDNCGKDQKASACCGGSCDKNGMKACCSGKEETAENCCKEKLNS
jgi:hypothetical protein